MIDYFEDLYDNVFEYAYESLTDDIVYNGYIITEATCEGVILTEAKSGKKKRKTKKDVFKLIRNTTIVLLLVIGLIKVIKKKIEKIKKKAEEAGYTKGMSDGKSEGYKSGRDGGYKNGYAHGHRDGKKEGYKDGYSEGRYAGKEEGSPSSYAAGYEYGKHIGQRSNKSYDIGYQQGSHAGYKKGLKDGRGDVLLSKTSFGTNSDEYYYVHALNDMTKYIMKIDSTITKRNGGKSVYDGNDIIKTLNNYIDVLQKQNKRLKGCNSQIKRISTNDNYIEELDAYKEVFEIAKTAKIVSGKIILLGEKIKVPIPDELKKKIDEII